MAGLRPGHLTLKNANFHCRFWTGAFVLGCAVLLKESLSDVQNFTLLLV
jgi:hypothetical protein